MTTQTDEVEQDEQTDERTLTPLRFYHETQRSLEKFRIQQTNRLSALQRGVDSAAKPVPEAYLRVAHLAEQMEAEIDTAIAQTLKSWAVWESWLKHVKGIGPSLGGQMLAMLLPPIPEKGPSSWYKAAGLYVVEVDGMSRLPRDRKDNPATHHRWLRRCLYNVATSFVRPAYTVTVTERDINRSHCLTKFPNIVH